MLFFPKKLTEGGLLKGVISLTQKQQIILDHLGGMSNREIARKLHMSKDTVNKYVKEYDEKKAELLLQDPQTDQKLILQDFVEAPKYKKRIRATRAVTEKAIEMIEECLKENEKKRHMGLHKQQMKKIDIYEHLIDQGLRISYSTVKRLVHDIEQRHEQAYIRQEYNPGDICEFDWGTVKLDIDGSGYKKYQMAVFASASSNYRYSKLYISQDTLAFQEAHVDLFEHCGGVFRTMVYDNMKTAVKRFVGPKEKEPTDALAQLSLYYGFGFRFCNVASGNEKGHVERSVEYVRRKAFSKKDKFYSLEEANNHLLAECMKLNVREIYNDTVPAQAFEEEKKALLPEVPRLECCRKTTGHADKYSTVMVEGNHYSVPDTLVGKTLDLRIYTDKIYIYHKEDLAAVHSRSYKKNDWQMDIYHYLRTLKKKPGALPQSTALLKADATVKKIFEDHYTKDVKTFLDVLEIINEKGVEKTYLAIKKLENISPKDMSADKVRALCEEDERPCEVQTPVGEDHLSILSKQTLEKYDMLVKLQSGCEERMAIL